MFFPFDEFECVAHIFASKCTYSFDDKHAHFAQLSNYCEISFFSLSSLTISYMFLFNRVENFVEFICLKLKRVDYVHTKYRFLYESIVVNNELLIF